MPLLLILNPYCFHSVQSILARSFLYAFCLNVFFFPLLETLWPFDLLWICFVLSLILLIIFPPAEKENITRICIFSISYVFFTSFFQFSCVNLFIYQQILSYCFILHQTPCTFHRRSVVKRRSEPNEQGWMFDSLPQQTRTNWHCRSYLRSTRSFGNLFYFFLFCFLGGKHQTVAMKSKDLIARGLDMWMEAYINSFNLYFLQS